MVYHFNVTMSLIIQNTADKMLLQKCLCRSSSNLRRSLSIWDTDDMKLICVCMDCRTVLGFRLLIHSYFPYSRWLLLSNVYQNVEATIEASLKNNKDYALFCDLCMYAWQHFRLNCHVRLLSLYIWSGRKTMLLKWNSGWGAYVLR